MSQIVSFVGRALLGGVQAARLTPVDKLFLKGTIHAGSSVVSTIAGAVGSVASREAGYWSERQATNHIPDASSAVKAFWANQLGLAATTEILANHGIPFANAADIGGNKWTYYWDNIIRHQRPRLTNEQALDLWRQNALTSDECREILGWHGLTYPGDRDLLMRTRGWFDLGTATDLWRQGMLSDIEYGSALDRAGIGEVDARNLLLTQRGIAPLGAYQTWWLQGSVQDDVLVQRLARDGITDPGEQGRYLDQRDRTPQEIVIDRYHGGRLDAPAALASVQRFGYTVQAADALLNRDDTLSRSEAQTWWLRSDGAQFPEYVGALKASGLADEDRRALAMEAAMPLPSLAEARSMALRGAFDGQLVQRWGLDVGIPSQYRDAARWQGYDYQPRAIAAQPGPTDWPTLGEAYWRANVTLLTPHQGVEALRRLSGQRWRRYQAVAPGITEFTPDDLHALYRANGYSPVMEAWDRALAVPEYPIRDIRRRYLIEPGWRDQARRHLLRLGYLPTDADDILDTIDRMRQWRDQAPIRRLEEKGRALAYAAVKDGYALGSYSRSQAQQALLALGVDGGAIDSTLVGWDAEANQRASKELVARLKHGYMQGELSPGEVLLALDRAHIQTDRAALLLAQWAVLRTWGRRAASSAQILRWVARGLLATPVAVVRLANLGWTAPDVALMLADAEGSLRKLQAAALTASERTRAKAQRQLEQVIKAHAGAVKAAQQSLKKVTPIGTLKEWFTGEIASTEWIRARMEAMGYPPLAIDAYFAKWGQPKGQLGPEVLGTPEFPSPPEVSAPAPQPTTIQPGATRQIEAPPAPETNPPI